jgi:hypothetical protein
MRKTTLSILIAAGLVAVAGVAQATSYDTPAQAGEASTMTHGEPNARTTNSPYWDGTTYVYSDSYIPPTTVLGAGPSTTTVTTYSYTYPAVTYSVTPGYVLPAPPVSSYWNGYMNGATETSNVPMRAGEATTMTGGAPNMVTNNFAY